MTKESFKLFLKENPQLQQRVVKNFFDDKWGKYQIVRRKGKFLVVFYEEMRGELKYYECADKEDAYEYLHELLTKGNVPLSLTINEFLRLYKDTYGLIDIKEADFIPTLTKVLICFVVKTDIDKATFLKDNYDACCKKFLSFIEQFIIHKMYTYEFMLLSEEEVKRDYEGNYYYAMH